MLANLADVDHEKLDRRLKSVAAAVAEERGVAWRQTLASRILKRSKWLGTAIETAGHLYAPDHLHQVRIGAKKLRYALELAQDSGIAAAAKHVRALKRTQETLGRLHDLQILQQHVAAAQAAPVGRSVPHEGLGAVAGRIEEECRRLHGKYVAHLPALLDTLAAIRADVIPRLTRTTRSVKMTLKPARAARAKVS
jgi:CHAD domain-containing protein